MALSGKHGLSLHQVDVTTAFVNRTLEDEVYMQQSKGFKCQGKEEFVCKHNKSIYGLKQSPRYWNSTLDAYLKEMQFTQTTSDLCIYFWKTENSMMFIGVYGDDMILATKNEQQLKQVKEQYYCPISLILRILVNLSTSWYESRAEQGQWFLMDWTTYLYREFVKRQGMHDFKPTNTPWFETLVSCRNLMYLAVSTIAFTMNSLARFNSNSQNDHWKALKQVLRYLKGTNNVGILYKQDGSDKCIGYNDANWAGDTTDRKSKFGYILCSVVDLLLGAAKKKKPEMCGTVQYRS